MKKIIGISLLLIFLFACLPVNTVGASVSGVDYWLSTHKYTEEIETHVFDCSDTSPIVARYLQEMYGYDTLVVYSLGTYDNPGHAWVWVNINNGWYAIETTNGRGLGSIVFENKYYGEHYVCEWYDTWRYMK